MRLFEICILYSKIRLGQQHKGFFKGMVEKTGTGYRIDGYRIDGYRIDEYRIDGYRIDGYRILDKRIPDRRIPDRRINLVLIKKVYEIVERRFGDLGLNVSNGPI